ncbi:aspartyl-phosphate phosphatase Spo0E family protein [Bacillus sp. SCS-153A]|uniref:aspartyl-phosphate phosphatase Spo0E family protein n=1 Tax=Rossellomorea sedimentorum TaxID=3115294 RepID=UPI003905F785
MKENSSKLHQEIESVRTMLIQKVSETNGLNHSLVIKYSTLLDELIIKAQKNAS